MSVALHGLLLWPHAPRRDPVPALPGGAPALTAYLIAAPLAAPSSPAARRPAAMPAATLPAVAGPPMAVAPPRRAEPPAQDAPSQTGTGTGANAPAEAPRRPTFAGGSQPETEYWPRSRLSRGPQPRSPVVLTLPASWRTPGNYHAQFALYVDEQGVVQRVERLDNPDFPVALESQVRAAFMGVLFRPGEMNGTAVRARMVVEVDFNVAPPGLKR